MIYFWFINVLSKRLARMIFIFVDSIVI